MPKQTRRPEDQHNVFARQEPKHNFHQPQRANALGAHARRGPMQDTTGAPMTQRPSAVMNHVPATRNIPHGATPRKNEVETPEIQRKTIGGRVGPGRQAKHTRTVTGAQTFVKQNGRNTSNDTSLSTRVPCVSIYTNEFLESYFHAFRVSEFIQTIFLNLS